MLIIASLWKRFWSLVTRRAGNLLVAYLIVWFAFGVTYWIIAIVDSHNFIIQSDIDVTGRVNAFRSMTGYYVNDEALKPLIVGWDSQKHVTLGVGNPGDRELTTFLVGGDTLGDLWGQYYESKYLSRGATHFEWKVIKYDPAAVGIDAGKYVVEVTTYRVPGDANRSRLLLEQDWTQLEGKVDTGSFHFHTDVDPAETLRSGIFGALKVRYLPAYGYALRSLVASAKSFPDGAIIALGKAQAGSWPHPLPDYLYFSAVTITTLGFGDILPNSTLVRVLVSVEAILGVIVAGVCVSSVTGWKPSVPRDYGQ